MSTDCEHPSSPFYKLPYRVEFENDDTILIPKHIDKRISPVPAYRLTGAAIESMVNSARHKGIELYRNDIIRKLATIPPDKWIYADVIQALIAERLSCKLPLPMTPELVKWLAGGERGDSSNVVFAYMTGMKEATAKQCNKTFAPMDADDMSRCLKLIDIGGQTWRDAIPSLATLSPEWEKIVARWDKLEAFTRQCMKGDAPPMHWQTWREIIKQSP